MVAWLALAAALAGADHEVVDFTPGAQGEPVLVVTTPGVAFSGYLPLLWALEREGLAVHALRFACRGQGVDDLVEDIGEALDARPVPVTVVAHGLGATLALMAGPRGERVASYVLLAPVLGVEPGAALDVAASVPVGASAVLDARLEFGDHELSDVLLGEEHPPLGCAPARFAAEVQGWIRTREVPVDLSRIEAPVWLGVSLGDDVATVEATVPRSRELGGSRELVRFGRPRLDPLDFDHGQMLTHRIPVRRAARQARRRVRLDHDASVGEP